VLSTISTKNARHRAARGIQAAFIDVYVRACARAVVLMATSRGSGLFEASAARTVFESRTLFDRIEQRSIDCKRVLDGIA